MASTSNIFKNWKSLNPFTNEDSANDGSTNNSNISINVENPYSIASESSNLYSDAYSGDALYTPDISKQTTTPKMDWSRYLNYDTSSYKDDEDGNDERSAVSKAIHSKEFKDTMKYGAMAIDLFGNNSPMHKDNGMIDSGVNAASNALMATGNPYAMAGAVALKGLNQLDKAFGKKTIKYNSNERVSKSSGFGGVNAAQQTAMSNSNKKYRWSSGKQRRKDNKQIVLTAGIAQNASEILGTADKRQAMVDSGLQDVANSYNTRINKLNNVNVPIGKSGMKISDRIAAYKSKRSEQLNKPKNLIPDGALHARKNNIDSEYHITHKGVPVIMEDGGKTQQVAEIESGEIVFNLDVTKKIEELYKKYNSEEDKDSIALEAGKLIAKEILYNTDDRLDLINSVE